MSDQRILVRRKSNPTKWQCVLGDHLVEYQLHFSCLFHNIKAAISSPASNCCPTFSTAQLPVFRHSFHHSRDPLRLRAEQNSPHPSFLLSNLPLMHCHHARNGEFRLVTSSPLLLLSILVRRPTKRRASPLLGETANEIKDLFEGFRKSLFDLCNCCSNNLTMKIFSFSSFPLCKTWGGNKFLFLTVVVWIYDLFDPLY